MKYLFLSGVLLFTSFKLGVYNLKSLENDYEKILYQDDYSLIHTFKNNNGEILGNVFVKYVSNDLFSSLLIKTAGNKKADTLYFIDRTKFISKVGLEYEIVENNENNFFGYKTVVKKDDYITIIYFSDFGNNVSDYITIGRNYEKKMFEMLKI